MGGGRWHKIGMLGGILVCNDIVLQRETGKGTFGNYGEKENALQDLEKAILDAPSEAVRERLIGNRDKIIKTTRIIH